MRTSRDPDVLIRAFIEEGIEELPDNSYDVVRSSIDNTRQRVVIGPWREEVMRRYATYGIAAAAVVLIAVVGLQFLPGQRGGLFGGGPTPTPTVAATTAPTPVPTPTPEPTPSPIADPSGRLEQGRYVAHPFGEPNRDMSFTFDMPNDRWEAVAAEPGRTDGLLKADPHNSGVGLAFLLIDSLNSDPCNWSGTADDVDIGTTVEEFVSALTSSDDFETSEPEEVTLGEHSGKKVVITMPDWLPHPDSNADPDCDEQAYRIWNASEGFAFDAQGQEHTWNTWIMDIEGTLAVILAAHFPDSDEVRVAELLSIVESMEITAP